ncbi:MAG: AEC family transporter [Treponema sp.]|jgi:predicted permease|nr:AEC family transporter [Treponema sp.]
MDFQTSLISVGQLIALTLPGYFLSKAKMLPADIGNSLVTLLLFVAMPSLTISNFLKIDYSPELIIDMGLMVLFGFILLISSFFLTKLFLIKFTDNAAKRVCIAAGYMSNCSFIGVPIIQTFFPNNPQPILYVSMFMVAVSVLTWTLMIYIITGDKKYIRFNTSLINPGIVTLIIATPLLIFNVSFPNPVLRVFEYLAGMNTPLAMLIVGIRLADIKLKELFTSIKVFYLSFIKLVLIPLYTFGLLMLVRNIIHINAMTATTLFIVMAMPSASYVIVFSERYNGDHETAVKCVLLSSLLSILTIPFLMPLSAFF